MLCNIKLGPIHESDNRTFTKIPGEVQIPGIPTLDPRMILTLMHQQQTALENIVVKREIACNEQFLLFPFPFVHIFDIIPLLAAEFEEPKTGISGKGLNLFQNHSIYHKFQRSSNDKVYKFDRVEN